MSENPCVSSKFSFDEFWRDVLRKWLSLIEEYEDPHDLAYWHGERALTAVRPQWRELAHKSPKCCDRKQGNFHYAKSES